MKSYKLAGNKMFVFFMFSIIAAHFLVFAITIITVALQSPKFLAILLPITAFWFVALGFLIRHALNQIIEIRISDDGLLQLFSFQKK